jgi:DNA processing protein
VGHRRIERGDEEFPRHLSVVPTAPSCLFVRGAFLPADALAVAVVGSRRATPYGVDVAERLARDLAARGVTIVSGLARGVDSAAHRGALAAGGRTIAVLGSGVDVIYPPENRRLATAIEEAGAVVSELPPGTPPLPHHFPARNRIIAGLALGVVVVEAAERSGSLTTAGWAAELSREVMAVPGRVTSAESRGANRLIRDGAALVTSWEDVVGELPAPWRACVAAPMMATAPAETDVNDPERGRLLAVIGEECIGMDDVIERTGIPSGRVAALLLDLELAGRIRQLGGKRFVRALPA